MSADIEVDRQGSVIASSFRRERMLDKIRKRIKTGWPAVANRKVIREHWAEASRNSGSEVGELRYGRFASSQES
jgi:hypothetical protein